jgi:hypothetical protein
MPELVSRKESVARFMSMRTSSSLSSLSFITYYSRFSTRSIDQTHATDMGPNTISALPLDRNANLRDVVYNEIWCYVDREQLRWNTNARVTFKLIVWNRIDEIYISSLHAEKHY